MPQLKRSQINASIELARRTFPLHGINLPPFAHWTVEDWDNRDRDCDEIRHCMLG